jgi:hypothetical protein
MASRLSQRQKLATPSPTSTGQPAAYHRRLAASSETSLNDGDTVYSSLSCTPTGSNINAATALYSTIGGGSGGGKETSRQLARQLFGDIEGGGGGGSSTTGPTSLGSNGGLDYYRAKATASELLRRSQGNSWQEGSREARRRSRDHLRQRLQQLALTSETGSASVIEVIEPDSSEEEQFIQSFSWSRRQLNNPGGDNSIGQQLLSSSNPAAGSAGVQLSSSRSTPASGQRKNSVSSASSSSSSTFAAAAPPSSSVSGDRPLLVKSRGGNTEPDILNGVRDVGEDSQHRLENTVTQRAGNGGNEASDGSSYLDCADDQQRQHQQPTSLYYDERPDSVSSQKRRGFLKKLSLWGQQANSSSSNNNKNGKKMTAGDSPPVGRPGDGKPIETEPVMRHVQREESPVVRAGRRANSVTRIEVAAAAAVATTAGVDVRTAPEGGGRTGEEEEDGVYAPAQHLVDPRLSKSLSPGSRKQQSSSYSSYIR